MDAENLADRLMEKLRPRIVAAVKEAFDAGADDMRDRILTAASSSTDIKEPEPIPRPKLVPPVRRSGIKKAPRGLVGQLIAAALTEKPGLRIVDIEGIVLEQDNRVAQKSIGNDLRRFEGDKYRRDDDGGWYLIPKHSEKETVEPSKTGGSTGTTLSPL